MRFLLFVLAGVASATRFECNRYSVALDFAPESNVVQTFVHGDSFVPDLGKLLRPHCLVPGSALSQFLHVMKHPDRTRPEAVQDTYTIAVGEAPLTFEIAGGSAGGGSSFAANVQNAKGLLATCDVYDNFDGTYLVVCPELGDFVTFRIQLTHVMFGAFAPFPDMHVMADLKAPLFECTAQTFRVDGTDNVWNAERQLATTRQPRRLFAGDLYMIGSSHMRYFYDAVLQEHGCNITHDKVRHDDESFQLPSGFNVTYLSRQHLSAEWAPEFTKHGIIETMAAIHAPRAAVFLLQFGSWDLHSVGLARTISTAVNWLGRLSGVTVTVMTPPVYPSGFQTGSWAGIRNNHAYSAIAEALECVPNRGYDVLDLSHVTRAFAELAIPGVGWACADHILCFDGAKFIGPYGLEVVRKYILPLVV